MISCSVFSHLLNHTNNCCLCCKDLVGMVFIMRHLARWKETKNYMVTLVLLVGAAVS